MRIFGILKKKVRGPPKFREKISWPPKILKNKFVAPQNFQKNFMAPKFFPHLKIQILCSRMTSQQPGEHLVTGIVAVWLIFMCLS